MLHALAAIWHWIQEVTGTNIGIPGHTPRWYNFHSGFEGDLGIYAAIGMLYWHHTCHQDKCPHWARYTTSAGDKVCKCHHPDMGKGFRLTALHIKHRHDNVKSTKGK